MSELEKLIPFLALFFIGCAAIVSTRAFWYGSSEPLIILSKLWIAMFAVELIGHYTRGDVENYWMYNLMHLWYYPVLANIYSHVLRNERLKIVIQIFYFVFVLFVLCNSIFIQGIKPLQTLTLVFGGCFISFLAGAYFWQLFITNEYELITRDPFFWLSFGLILYFGGTVPFLGMFNYLKTNFFDFTQFYFTYIYNGFSILLNIIIAITFLCRISYPKLS